MTDFTYIKKLFGIEKSDGFSAEEMQNLLKTSPIVSKVLSDYYTELGKITPSTPRKMCCFRLTRCSGQKTATI